MSKDPIPAGIPRVVGAGAPEGFTENYVTIFKGYFCKYASEKKWDVFHEPEVLLNDELRKNARAVLNEESEEEFHNALYDNNNDYARLVRYVLDCLVRQGMFEEKREQGDTSYSRTKKMRELCPEIRNVGLPVIKALVEKYDAEHK
jgi:predicted transcriptional regulator